MLPFIAIMFLLSRWAGRLADVWGPRMPLVAGPLVAAVGFALFALPSTGAVYWRSFLPAVCVLGLGMAVTVAPLTTTVMNSVGRDLSGVASGINNAVSRAAGLLAIAVLGIVMSNAFDHTLDEQLAVLDLPVPLQRAVAEQRHKLAAIEVPEGVDAATAAAVREAVGTAFVAGFRQVMLVCAALALLSAASAALLIRARAGPAAATQEPT